MSVNPPNMQPYIQMQAPASTQGASVTSQGMPTPVRVQRNVIETIDKQLEKAGFDPNTDKVECNGTVERENPNDLESPLKITTYYNEELGCHCYKIPLVWEIKIIKGDGTEKIIPPVVQNRLSTLPAPPVNKLLLETDRAYRAFVLGNEYAKTISAVFDTDNPEYAEMQKRKPDLLQNDTLLITVKPHWFYNLAFAMGSVADPYDPDVLFKGFGSSTVQWAGTDGKKVDVINRTFGKEIYKVDRAAQRTFRTMKKRRSPDTYFLNGFEILLTKRIKLDRETGWFKKLTEMEEIKKDNLNKLDQELTDNHIPPKDWAERVSKKAPKLFNEGLRYFGSGAYKKEHFPQIADQINDLKKDPIKNKDTLETLQKEFDALPKQIAEIRNFADQLEHLEAQGVKISTDKYTQWDVSRMREKAQYMEDFHAALKPVLGQDPNVQVIPA